MQPPHCKPCLARNSEPELDRLATLFNEPHEGARLCRCRGCAQSYVVYFLAYRGDDLSYTCPITEEECQSVQAATDPRALIRDLVRSRSVYFRSPWTAGWTDGQRVLVEPNPW